MEVMERRTSPRNVYARLIASMRGIDPDTVAASDRLMDESLTLLENEEPGLLRWLSTDPDIDRLLGTHTVALHQLLTGDARRGYSFEHTMGRVDALNYRLACTMAIASAMRERPLAKEVRPWSQD